ncbi:hypothetical protein O6H91_Y316600 [Diphasiastrum complanatum]|nr:hypothetical protein O6H91_Y316600 [Diphasiastrum complanatum]
MRIDGIQIRCDATCKNATKNTTIFFLRQTMLQKKLLQKITKVKMLQKFATIFFCDNNFAKKRPKFCKKKNFEKFFFAKKTTKSCEKSDNFFFYKTFAKNATIFLRPKICEQWD